MKWVLNISRHDFCTIQRKIGDFRLHFCKIDPKIVKISRLGPKFDLTRLKSTWQKFDLTQLTLNTKGPQVFYEFLIVP